ncbi:Abequosyltransferase RfbV [Marinomonas spartinae]|uniref:glycosyltransferase family 2 protein n=1 Tax=Marinomonas spartinae TaxID=1792290 RepID=UPI00080904EA|nr:glycosyltransferase [Marinomonas spartinae]SBS40425.1 Abequosyltransferase RfbV [Marinomonas spartinae]
MLLSIVVLSYNRPLQVKRILESFSGVSEKCTKDFEVIIKDDNSPKFKELEEIFFSFKEGCFSNFTLYKNSENLGYDRNLLDSFDVANGEYVFLLSDDDYIDGQKIEKVLSCIKSDKQDVYFTPYCSHDNVKVNRNAIFSAKNIKNFPDLIYNSILFSGLVFSREKVLSLDLDKEFLGDCIYTQVYLSVLLVFNSGSYGLLPEGVLYLGGDGENFFGKNQSAKNSDVLKDRANISANLNYQPFLINVIKRVSSETNLDIYRFFISQYKKRLYSYGLRARGMGIDVFSQFFWGYVKSKSPFYFIHFSFFCLLFLVPKKIALFVNEVGLRFLRKSG